MHHLEKSPLFWTTQPKLSIFVYVFHFHSKVEVHLRSKTLVISLSMSTFTQDWLFSKFYELILEDEIFIILIPITVSLLAVSIPADRNIVVLCIFDMLWYHPEWTRFLWMFPCMHPSSAVIPSFQKCLLLQVTIQKVSVVPGLAVQSNRSWMNCGVGTIGGLEVCDYSQWLHLHSKKLYLSL